MNTIIAPSILAADFANLQSEIEIINKSEADWFHIDIMDGLFVPNISFGMPILSAIKKHAQKPLDVHLMIVDPERYIKIFYELNASIITIHFEATSNLIETLKELRNIALQEQDPLVVKTLRLMYEFIEENKNFNVQAQYEEDDEGNEYPLEIEDTENLVYLLTLLKDA